MLTIDLNLPISKNKFIRWLQRYVDSTRDESIPTPRGSITISNLTIWGMDDLLTSAAIDGILSLSDDELAAMSPGARRLSDLYGNKRNATGLIAFRFRQDRQLNVIVSHDDPALLSYFDALVAAINDRWLKKAHEQDIILHVPQPAPTGNSGRNKGGRPRNLDDNWAWVEVRVNGRSSGEVEGERLALELREYAFTEEEQSVIVERAEALRQKVTNGKPTLAQKREFLRALDMRVTICKGHQEMNVSYILGDTALQIEYSYRMFRERQGT